MARSRMVIFSFMARCDKPSQAGIQGWMIIEAKGDTISIRQNPPCNICIFLVAISNPSPPMKFLLNATAIFHAGSNRIKATIDMNGSDPVMVAPINITNGRKHSNGPITRLEMDDPNRCTSVRLPFPKFLSR